MNGVCCSQATVNCSETIRIFPQQKKKKQNIIMDLNDCLNKTNHLKIRKIRNVFFIWSFSNDFHVLSNHIFFIFILRNERFKKMKQTKDSSIWAAVRTQLALHRLVGLKSKPNGDEILLREGMLCVKLSLRLLTDSSVVGRRST